MLNVEHKQVRSSIFYPKISTDMPWSTSNRVVQNAAQFFFSPLLGRSLNIIEKIEGLSLVDTSFAPRDNPRPVIFFGHVTLLPPYTGHGGHYNTKYSLFD